MGVCPIRKFDRGDMPERLESGNSFEKNKRVRNAFLFSFLAVSATRASEAHVGECAEALMTDAILRGLLAAGGTRMASPQRLLA